MHIVAESKYDEIDRRLISALQSVEVPNDLESRIRQALQSASQQELKQPSDSVANAMEVGQSIHVDRAENLVPVPQRVSKIWNRRNWIAASVAAGLGGLVIGYRELTRPLSQWWLIKSTQSLLAQLEQPQWTALTSEQSADLKRDLDELGFLRQVGGIVLVAICDLRPPMYVQSARAVDLGNELILLELTIERGVQGVSAVLGKLEWSRSDSMAVAMQRDNRTLVLTGPATLRAHILPARTT